MKGKFPRVMGFLLLTSCCWQTVFAQLQTDSLNTPDFPVPKILNHFRHESMFITENDNYTLQIRDGYYTNGVMLRFSYAKNQQKLAARKKPVEKIVTAFEAGQMIFNPVRFDSLNVETQDRPFAGYLYGKYEQRIFKHANSVWQWNVNVGTIGKNSYAKNVQRWYHNVIGIYDVEGWSTQVTNEWSVNVGSLYAQSFFKKPQEDRSYDIAGVVQANLGNAFTDATAGILFKAGLMENYYNSAHWGGRVSAAGGKAPVHHKEFYFFVHPALTWQAYNATLQGGVFVQDKGPKTSELNPFYMSTQIGFKLAQNRWTIGATFVNRTRQVVNQARNENFMSLQFAYRTGTYTF